MRWRWPIHERATDRLIGTCAFSQLDGENGSALYHITIGEKDAWGQGYGTEATQLMLDHAFGTLGLHRVALFVFEFNERAIRAYRRCGFVVEGRSRESIWRDGRWWDELAMSVLESDWRRAARAGPRQRRTPATGASAQTAGTGANPWVPAPPTCCGAHHSAGGDDAARAQPPTPHGRTSASSSRRRATPSTTLGPRSSGSMRPSRPATSCARPRWTCTSRDLMRALEQDEGEKLGGKSAEAARFILRAIDRELDQA